MKKRIYVEDSYHTETIVRNLQKIVGENASVVDSLSGEGKFDFFFLSGRDVKDGHHNIPEMKKNLGNPGIKAIAVSTLPSYLVSIQKQPELDVDYVLDKSVLVEGLVLATSPRPGSDGEKLLSILDMNLSD